MSHQTITFAIAFILCPHVHLAAEQFIVKDGQSLAEIVVAADAPRTTWLAAYELQKYVNKVSGAQLPIVTKPSGTMPLKLFVGQSPHTQTLGITAGGLRYGAYRIAAGEGWVVFIGDDTEFVPIEPWPRGYTDIRSGKMQQAWDAITGEHWGYPLSQLHKHYSGPNALFGTPDEEKVDNEGNVNVWTYDERGSFNAVCGFLRDLGVRWYMPGEIGEVVPRMKTIPAPKGDRTVRPDFELRILNFRAGIYGREPNMWAFHLGVRQPYGRQAAHGLARMTNNEYTLTHHPEWFALYGGKRHTQPGQHNHQLCYSNEELLRQAVRFAQVQFDHYKMDVVSIMPPDGYTAICQCTLCEGKESPELGERGRLSNYVWDFVNRVAKEVAKTHPDKKISCCAYGVYTEPPSNIDKLEPNVQVIIVGGRRPTSDRPEQRDQLRRLRAAWTKKTDNPLVIFENYPFTGRGFYLPAYIPRVMGESINETKGVSRGEDVWLTMDFSDKAIGFNHFLIYFTARMYWGGKSQDALKMFDEYCRLFYGPAAEQMLAFFQYCENNWREMETDGQKASRALDLFDLAKASAPEGSIYARRIQLIDNYLEGLRNKRRQLAQKRGPVPKLRLVGDPQGEIVVDGKFDDALWAHCPVASTGRMRELQTGRQPVYGTSFKSVWIGHNLYFAIRCEEHPGQTPNIAATKDDDPAIWYGDTVEILLETDSHSYYQLAISPSGALVDLDRGAGRDRWFSWDSQAEVATLIADDHWNVELRIPITQDENDPLHQVIGRKPTQSLPWHINLCRQRIRENGEEFSAFSPTGTKSFHATMKFGHFYRGHSHEFPADPNVTDYVIARQQAGELGRTGKRKEAIDEYVSLSAREDLTEFQKSDALEQAAALARSLQELERAEQLARQIPIEAVAKTVQMENLLAQRKIIALIDRFGNENWDEWPYWQIGAGAFARARAFVALKEGEKAETDLQTALAYTSSERARIAITATMGFNREMNLKDDGGALAAYRRNFENKERIGAADEFRSVQGAARILTRQGKFEEALATLKRADIEHLQGYWRNALLLSLGETLAAAGRTSKAIKAYREVLADGKALKSHRTAAETALESLAR